MSDGRLLGFQSLGNPDGKALFFFHGTPGSRLTLAADDLLVQSLDANIIVPDRPGYGLSDAKPDRTLIEWPDDVLQLADHLEIDNFAVAGESGGGPHAVSCAFAIPDRVTMALLLGSPSPAGFKGATQGMSFGNRIGFKLNRFAPWLVRFMIRQGALAFNREPESYLDALAVQMSEPDRELLNNSLFRSAIIRDFQEAYRQGPEAHVVDAQLSLASRDWGFSFSSISVPVFVWHGKADTLASRNMAEFLCRQLPNSKCHIVSDAGHMLTEHPTVISQLKTALHGETVAP